MDKLSLEVEFPIDNERLQKEAKEARAQIEGVGETAEKVQVRVEKEISEVAAKANQKYVEREGILERLKRRMAELSAVAEKSTSVIAIEKANAEIELFEKEINRLSKVGRQGFDDMGKAIPDFAIPTGKIERLTYAAKLYQKAITQATNPDLIAKYNAKLEQTNIEINRLKNVGKTGFDELGNKIVSAEKDTSKFVGTLSAGVERLRRLAYIIPGLGLTGLLAMAIGPLTKWIKTLGQATDAQKAFNTVAQESSKNIAKEVAETEILIDKINNKNTSEQERQSLLDDFISKNPAVLGALNLQNIATLEGKGILDSYITSFKEKIRLQSLEQGYINSVQKAADLRSGALADETDFKWYNTLARAAGDMFTFRRDMEGTFKDIEEINKQRREDAAKTQDAISESLLKGIEAETKSAKKIKEVKDTSLKALEIQLSTVNEKLRKAQEGEDTKTLQAQKVALEAQVKQRVKLLGLETGKKTVGVGGDGAIRATQALEQKIFDIKSEFFRKALTKDEEELQALRDKFVKIAIEVDRFNKNPKNKVKVSTEGLAEVRDAAIADLVYKQDTEKLKISLSEQKRLYQDYEEYKISLGKDKADEKYRDLINTEKSHLENLRAELEKIPVDDASGSQVARKEELEKQIREEESLLLKKFNDLLKANQDYQSKVAIAIEQFESEKKDLIEKGALEEVEILTANHDLNLQNLTESHVKQLDAYKKLYEGIEHLSNDEAKKVIDDAMKMLAETDMPEALYIKIMALIREADKALGDRIYERVGEIGKAFDEMASGVGDMNEGLRNSLGILGDMLHSASTVGKSIGSIKTGIADYGANKENAGGGVLGVISGVSAIAGPIGQAVGALAGLAKGIFGVFKAAKESRIQAEKELAEFDAQKFNAEFEIDAMYRDRLRTQNEINKSSIDGLKEYSKLLKEQQKEVATDADKLMKSLQGEQYVAGKKTERHGGFLGIGRKTRTIDVMDSLAGKSYEDIQKLFMSNQLTDKAKELFLQLEKLKKEGIDVDGMLAENTAANWEKVTGATSESITESIIKGFENGYRSAEDFADDFAGMMSGAARSFFKDFIQNQEVEAFYARFAEMSEDGMLTDAQREELKLEYEAMVRRINTKREELEKVAGGDFLSDAGKKSEGMAGSIQKITQQQADVLSGQVGGIHMAVIQSNEMRKEHLNFAQEQTERLRESYMVQMDIEKNTKQTATNTNRLEKIENTLVSMDKKMTNDTALRAGGR